ncbi:MAG: MATE family efflux transporter [Planctomycetota bacterium]
MAPPQDPQSDALSNSSGPPVSSQPSPAQGMRGALVGTGEPAPPATPERGKAATRQLSGRLAGLSLPRQVWVLSLWPLLEQVLNFLVGVADFAIAGRLPGDNTSLDALDAISVASFFVWLMTILQAAVGVGASALVSRAIGASHRRVANAGLGQSLLLGTGLSIIAAVGVFAGAAWIARVFGLQGQAAEMATAYIRLTALGIPMCGVLFVGGAVLRAAGDTRSPFIAMLLVNLVNVVCSVGLGGLRYGPPDDPQVIGLGLGVTGIAIGTAAAWTVGGGVTLYILLSGRSDIRLRRHRLLPHWHTMRRILRVATPNLWYQIAFWGINLGLLVYISWLPEKGAYGAHSIAMRIHSISFLPGYAISIAASTLTGQYLGLGDPLRARKATFMALMATMILVCCCGIIFLLIPEVLVKALSPTTPEHLELAPPLLRVVAFVMPMLAVNLILNGAVTGAGDTRNAAIINLSGLLIFRLLGAYLLAFPMGLGLMGIWIAIVIDISIRGVVFTGYYLTGRWQRVDV